jgi:uncharacterized protein YqiB (DUF1249 family)
VIESKIFEKLVKLGLVRHDGKPAFNKYVKLQSEGLMDLHVDLLESNEDFYIIALSHTFEINGDLVPDPDMEIRIFPRLRIAEALTYQDQFIFQRVYPKPNLVNPKLKKALNIFLNQWLSNLIIQGFKLKRTYSIDKNTKTLLEVVIRLPSGVPYNIPGADAQKLIDLFQLNLEQRHYNATGEISATFNYKGETLRLEKKWNGQYALFHGEWRE